MLLLVTGLVTEAPNMRPNKGSDPVAYTTNLMIRNLARRVKALNTEMREVDRMLTELLTETAPSLLDLHGVGVDTAASLLVAAGDNPDRIGSKVLGLTSAGPHPCQPPPAKQPDTG